MAMDLQQALQKASDTRQLELGYGLLSRCAEVFARQFGTKPALIVADTNTFAAAGKRVADLLKCKSPFVFTDPDLFAEHRYVEQLEAALKQTDGIPVAVGSGVINDLTKLAAF